VIDDLLATIYISLSAGSFATYHAEQPYDYICLAYNFFHTV